MLKLRQYRVKLEVILSDPPDYFFDAPLNYLLESGAIENARLKLIEEIMEDARAKD